MREAAFLKRNADRWREFETVLNDPRRAAPDRLADLMVQVTDDLAYARTHYPASTTTTFLNGLALRAHGAIYKNRRERGNRIARFVKEEAPRAFWEARRELLMAAVIFAVCVAIGVLSSGRDDNFARLILGDNYVNMTLENIRKGDPLAVYKHSSSFDMFVMIALNNLKVAMLCLALGICTSFGTMLVLFQNGLMVGVFQNFFHRYNVLYESALVIWIHGTLEMASFIVAAAAGFSIGNAILFPGTYSRGTALRMGARRGLKILVALMPIIVLAAFFESYVTRRTDMPQELSLTIIIGSLAFMVWYVVLLPRHRYRRETLSHLSITS